MKRICIFCGSNRGRKSDYELAAERLGRIIADRHMGLVYGGASVGIMGIIADTVLAMGGEVIGVMPRLLVEKEVSHDGLTELRVVGSMHERKQVMADLADGFIAMPGGFGTLDEFFEVVTWGQLGMHAKPCGLLNIGGYFNGLMGFLDHAVAEGFVMQAHRAMILLHEDPVDLLDAFARYSPPTVGKWTELRN